MVRRERRMWKRCKGVLWRELLGDDDVMVVNRGQGKGEWGRGIGERASDRSMWPAALVPGRCFRTRPRRRADTIMACGKPWRSTGWLTDANSTTGGGSFYSDLAN